MIGDQIRNLRLMKKMTQGQLIEDIASITYLSKVENNQTNPTKQFIAKIAERIGYFKGERIQIPFPR